MYSWRKGDFSRVVHALLSTGSIAFSLARSIWGQHIFNKTFKAVWLIWASILINRAIPVMCVVGATLLVYPVWSVFVASINCLPACWRHSLKHDSIQLYDQASAASQDTSCIRYLFAKGKSGGNIPRSMRPLYDSIHPPRGPQPSLTQWKVSLMDTSHCANTQWLTRPFGNPSVHCDCQRNWNLMCFNLRFTKEWTTLLLIISQNTTMLT